MFKPSVHTSQKSHNVHIKKTNWSTLFQKLITVYCLNHIDTQKYWYYSRWYIQ